jgi:peptide deformylase
VYKKVLGTKIEPWDNRIMSKHEILQLGNPVLWEKSSKIEDLFSFETGSLISDLSDTLGAFREVNGFGRAIAAPQIGTLKRMIFIRMQPTGFYGPLINPEIVWSDERQIELWDDCFSFPDLLVRVRRSAQIQVDYFDEHGSKQSLKAEGDLSELLQHEIDHLDGVLAIQRAISAQAFSTRAEWERKLR